MVERFTWYDNVLGHGSRRAITRAAEFSSRLLRAQRRLDCEIHTIDRPALPIVLSLFVGHHRHAPKDGSELTRLTTLYHFRKFR
jgi:hypothetical protein